MFHTMNAVPQEAATPKGDPIALAIFLALMAIFVVWVIMNKKRKKKEDAAVTEEAPVVAPATQAPGAASELKLHDVEPKTAAMLMAIVANKIDKPLNELRFISIKEVK